MASFFDDGQTADASASAPNQSGDIEAIKNAYLKVGGRLPSDSELANHLDTFSRYGSDAGMQNLQEQLPIRFPNGGAGGASGSSGASGGGTSSYQPFNEAFSFSFDPSSDPSASFVRDQAMKSLERKSLAGGALRTTGAGKEFQKEAAGLASQQYSGAYNRAWDEYLGRAGIWTQNQNGMVSSARNNKLDDFNIMDRNREFGQSSSLNKFNMDRTTSNDDFSHLYDFANLGLGATTGLGNLGARYGASGSDTIQNQGNANAAGQVGSANAWNSAIGNMTDFAQLAALTRNNPRKMN